MVTLAGYAIDMLVIGLIIVLLIGVIKAPIKGVLKKRGLLEGEKASQTFKAIVTAISFLLAFGGAVGFFFFQGVNPFENGRVWTYTIGILGSSQTIYQIYEVYGRDGVFKLIKGAVTKGLKTEIDKLTLDPDVFGKQVAELVSKEFEGAPDISEIVTAAVKKLQDHS